jgi:hypothetical protein
MEMIGNELYIHREPKQLGKMRKKIKGFVKEMASLKDQLEKLEQRQALEEDWGDDGKDDGSKPAELHVPFEKFNPVCMICMNYFQSKDMVRTIAHAEADKEQCGHCFHAACIDKWLSPQHHSDSTLDDVEVRQADFCPVCMAKVDREVWA